MNKQVVSKLKRLDREMKAELKRLNRMAYKDIESNFKYLDSMIALKAVQDELRVIIDHLTVQSDVIITENLNQTYLNRYYGNLYTIEQTIRRNLEWTALDNIDKEIDMMIDGKTYHDRLKSYDKTDDIVSLMLNHVIRGGALYTLNTGVKEIMRQHLNQTINLAETEQSRVGSIASLESMYEAEEHGVNLRKKWISTLDERTRERHQELDGQIKDLDEEFEIGGYTAQAPGLFGAPEMDIGCRCDVISEVEGILPDMRKDNITKDYIEYTDYEEWLKFYI